MERGRNARYRDPLRILLIMPDVPPFVADVPPLLFVAGKGGVGKTTCAAATALWHARRQQHASGRPVLLISTDPAHSIDDRLNEVACPDTLHTEAFDAQAAVESFREAHHDTLHEIVARGTFFDDADIQELLDLALPGIDEAMAVLRLEELLSDDTYARVIVDTAPTGHTLRLFEMPRRFVTWVDFLDVLLEKHRYMRARFSGRTDPDALDTFVSSLWTRAERVMQTLRTADQAGVLVVTQAEPAIAKETDRLISHLHDASVAVPAVVINQWQGDAEAEALPAMCPSDMCWTLPALSQSELQEHLPTLWTRAARYDSVSPGGGSANESRSALSEEQSAPHTRGIPRVAHAAPWPRHELLLVAGKGGVGKTTIACATALRLAGEKNPSHTDEQRVLLLSTDPAHSLADILNTEVHDTPAGVAPGLDAACVDAEARFERLRGAYVDEVQQFFQQTGGRFDMPHDRQVAEHLLDLAPPGIDEIMGITATLDQLEDDRYTHVVLDMAPTGHFFRFIEMPEVFNAWIRSLFRLLRTYRRMIHAPRLNDRLVRLSKQVKTLRRMLQGTHDTRTGCVYGVTMQDRMVHAETERLVNHCTRAGLSIPTLFVNRAVRLASNQLEGPASVHTIDRIRTDFPDQHVVRVERGTPPVGIDTLRALGRALYASP